MRDRPAGLSEGELVAALGEGWGVEAGSVEYRPVGFGGYHWAVTGRDGAAWFVTVDDVGLAEGEFARLSRSLETAVALHRDAGLGFVLAPVPATGGAALRRLSSRYAVSVSPLVDGSAGDFGPHRPADLAEITGFVAELHRATPAVAHLAPRAGLSLPGRAGLEAALAELGRPWAGGPHAEAARALLAVHERRVRGRLAEFDRLAGEVRRGEDGWTVTHGEPHPGNVLRTPSGAWLVDWATVRLAPPERDVWMLTDAFAGMLGEEPGGADAEVLARYSRVSGRTVSPVGIALYRLWWPLADVAAFLGDLRRPHGDGADAAAALHYLGLNLTAAV